MFSLTSVLNEVVQVACPLLTGAVLPPLHVKWFAGSENCDCAFVHRALEVTVPVKVTELPGAVVNDGSLLDDTDVVVGEATMTAVKFAVTLCRGVMVMLVVALLNSRRCRSS